MTDDSVRRMSALLHAAEAEAAHRGLTCVAVGLQLAYQVQDVYHIITAQSSITALLVQEDKVHSLLSWL